MKIAQRIIVTKEEFYCVLKLHLRKTFFFSNSIMHKYEGQSKITESWFISFYWVGSFG